MLMQRFITAVIFALLVIALILLAPASWMALAFALLVLAGAWEWAALAGLNTPLARLAYVGLMASCLAVLGFVFGLETQAQPQALRALLWFSAGFWLLALLAVIGYPRAASLWSGNWRLGLIGILVLAPAWLAALYLRSQMFGEYLVISAIAIIAFADIGAYFAGRAIGGPKLAPRVSPAKTWAGVGGGVAASLGLAITVAWIAGSDGEKLRIWLCVALLAALASVVGDLLESMVKRHCGIKDSGSLLPGHGGLLDRLDGLAAGLPIFALGLMCAGVQ